MNLGENIYRLRTARNLSQGALADALEVSRQSVSKWENNSATPELDKLIKMSELFGVTLDELVGKEDRKIHPSDAQDHLVPPTQQRIIYIEKFSASNISKQSLLGCMLLLTAVVYALLLNTTSLGGTESMIMAAPVAVCGILCLFTRHPPLYCGWVGAGSYWLYLFILFHRWEHQYALLLLGIIVVIAMIIWTVKAHHAGAIRVPLWLWWIGGLVLTGLLILLIMNTVPPFWIGSAEHATTTN